MEALRKDTHYTFEDYMSWDDNQRWEIIDGVPYAMAPPSTTHQRVVSRLHGQIYNFLRGKPCEAFVAPFGVRLNAEKNDTVVEPDIAVVCDKNKLDKNGCKGAPDLIIEILSPSTLRYDRIVKFNKYLAAGVREYWIIDPEEKFVGVNILAGEHYIHKPYGEGEDVPVTIFPGCVIHMSEVFAE